MADAVNIEDNLSRGERINQLVEEHYTKLKNPVSGMDYFLDGGQDKQFTEIAKAVGIKKEGVSSISMAIGMVCATAPSKPDALQRVEKALEEAYQKGRYSDDVFKNVRTMSLKFLDNMWALAESSSSKPRSTMTMFRSKKGGLEAF
ncbi:MAG: hypothetical protein NT162_03415 [Candidatus Woesebacteria bacterium]|nr:hypothetical protein [Candidatus Woesebacteria bacterium]